MNAGSYQHCYRRLLRRVLSVEAGLRAYRPSDRRMPAKPDRADEVLALLAGHFEPGDPVGHRQMKAVAGVDGNLASAIRTWAQATGAWPYAKPPNLPAAWANRPRRKRGGAS
jgi:hypothetical protein